MPRHSAPPVEPPAPPSHAGRYVRDPAASVWDRTDEDAVQPGVQTSVETSVVAELPNVVEESPSLAAEPSPPAED